MTVHERHMTKTFSFTCLNIHMFPHTNQTKHHKCNKNWKPIYTLSVRNMQAFSKRISRHGCIEQLTFYQKQVMLSLYSCRNSEIFCNKSRCRAHRSASSSSFFFFCVCFLKRAQFLAHAGCSYTTFSAQCAIILWRLTWLFIKVEWPHELLVVYCRRFMFDRFLCELRTLWVFGILLSYLKKLSNLKYIRNFISIY